LTGVTLFPYTRLFRSWVDARAAGRVALHFEAHNVVAEVVGEAEVKGVPLLRPVREDGNVFQPPFQPPRFDGHILPLLLVALIAVDRKSTRLNSSHVKI